jgi:hypothetical protein
MGTAVGVEGGIIVSAIRVWLIAGAVLQGAFGQPSTAERKLADNPTYSTARLHGGTPEELLRKRETALASSSSDFQRIWHLSQAARAALEAGANAKARKYAMEALTLGERYRQRERLPIFKDGIPIATAVANGHLVLGRLALLDGDVEEAKKQLLLYAQMPGPNLPNVDGPNMSLARELLKHSERDTVLEFLQLCKSFWTEDQGKIAEWSLIISKGGTPDFGANLFY